jgi:hypothetical protein
VMNFLAFVTKPRQGGAKGWCPATGSRRDFMRFFLVSPTPEAWHEPCSTQCKAAQRRHRRRSAQQPQVKPERSTSHSARHPQKEPVRSGVCQTGFKASRLRLDLGSRQPS